MRVVSGGGVSDRGVVRYWGGVDHRGCVDHRGGVDVVGRGVGIVGRGVLVVADDALGGDSVAVKTSVGRGQESAESYDLELQRLISAALTIIVIFCFDLAQIPIYTFFLAGDYLVPFFTVGSNHWCRLYSTRSLFLCNVYSRCM